MRLSTLALPVAAAVSVSAAHGRNLRRAHHDLVARNATERSVEERDLTKRYSNARLTYYDITVGETSCEGFYSASDYVVALDSNLYGTYWKSPYCGSQITITYNGKSAVATIVDECPGCPTGGLDLTQGLFEHFADTSVGVLSASWSFNDGSSGGDSGSETTSTKKADPTTTSTKKHTTTTPAYTPPAETTTSTKKQVTTTHTTSTTPTSTHHSTTSTTPTSTSHSTSSTPTTTSTKATPTTTSSVAPTSSIAALVGAGSALAAAPTDTIEVTSSSPQIINQVNYAVFGLANLVMSS